MKRVLAALLTFLLILGIVPVVSFATSDEVVDASELEPKPNEVVDTLDFESSPNDVVGMAAAPEIFEVRPIDMPVTGIFPASLFKYPYKANSYVKNVFTQTITWVPAIESTFLPDTEYKAILELAPTSDWSKSGLQGGASFRSNNITHADIKGLPTESVKEITSNYSGNNLQIQITFNKTGAVASEAELIFHEDFSSGVNADKTLGDERKFMLTRQQVGEWDAWVDEMTSVVDGNLEVRYKKASELAPDTRTQRQKDNFIKSGGVRSIGRSAYQGGGGFSDDVVLFENTFGYYEINVKFPQSNGVMGAFWLFSSALGEPLSKEDGGSKYASEIDIIESYGWADSDREFTAAVISYRGGGGNSDYEGVFGLKGGKKSTGVDIYDGEFHKIALEWSPSEYKFFVDGVMFANVKDKNTYPGNEGVMLNPAYIKLSVGGGDWVDVARKGVYPDESKMVVDFVKVWNGPRPSSDTDSQTKVPDPVKTYTITFDSNCDSIAATTQMTGADGKLTSLPTLTREGYTFNGWYMEQTGGTEIDINYVFTENTTVYAQWTAIPVKTYTIAFDSNCDSIAATTQMTGADGKLTSLPTLTREGYTFNGWYTEQTGGTAIDTSSVFAENTTVYAQWTVISVKTYTITFNGNGGRSFHVTQETSADGRLTDLPAPTREGYTFNGWYTRKTGGTAIDTNYIFTENTTVNAQWTIVPVKPNKWWWRIWHVWRLFWR